MVRFVRDTSTNDYAPRSPEGKKQIPIRLRSLTPLPSRSPTHLSVAQHGPGVTNNLRITATIAFLLRVLRPPLIRGNTARKWASLCTADQAAWFSALRKSGLPRLLMRPCNVGNLGIFQI